MTTTRPGRPVPDTLFDAAVLIGFAIAGQDEHSGAIDLGETIAIASPFLIGWFLTAAVLGLYGTRLRSLEWPAWTRWVATGFVGVGLGLALRGLFGRGVSGAFPVVTLVFILGLTGLWRLIAAGLASRAQA